MRLRGVAGVDVLLVEAGGLGCSPRNRRIGARVGGLESSSRKRAAVLFH